MSQSAVNQSTVGNQHFIVSQTAIKKPKHNRTRMALAMPIGIPQIKNKIYAD